MKKFAAIFFVFTFISSLFAESGNQNVTLSQSITSAESVTHSSSSSRTPVRDDRILLDVFTEDFENDAEGWNTLDLTNVDTAWHKSDFLRRDEDNLAWWCGDTLTEFDVDYFGYNNSWLQYLDTPVLDLSEAADGLRLTFDGWWLIEDPRRVPPPDPFDGWDGFLVMISTDGGEEFSAINPDTPEYTAERIAAAERWWDFGPAPAWTFMSGEWAEEGEPNPEPEWVDVIFDLADYTSEEEVVIRFVLASDRTVSAPFNPYLANSGILLDNIIIEDDDGNVFLYNDADDDPEPAELIPRRGEGFGDWWELIDTNRPGGDGENSMWLEDDHVSLFNALESPPIDIPDEMNVFFQYWIFCDLQDSDGDGDNQLEDFYNIFLSDDDGESWSRQHYDYNREGAGGDGWMHYVPGTPFGNVNVDMDLSEWGGETILLRWIVQTDHDDDGGVGEGLFIDDIQVVSDDRMARDAGMENMILPYPTTVGHRIPDVTVEMYNYGTRDLQSVSAGWGWTDPNGERYYPIVPLPDVDAEEFVFIELTDFVNRQIPGWTPTIPGEYTVWAESRLGGNTGDPDDDDQAPENDRVDFESVRINPANIYELGYDRRSYQFLNNFDAGFGPATRFSPEDADLWQYNIASLKMQFNGMQENASYRLHILEVGEDDSTPGEEIHSQDVSVTPQETIPNWHTVMLYENQAMRNREGDFWVWVEILRDDGRPAIVWDTQQDDNSHYFSFNGDEAAEFQGDLMMHAVVVPEAVESPIMVASTDLLDYDVIYIGEEITMQVRLYATAFAPVTINSITTETDEFTVDFPESVVLDFGEYYAVDVLYTPNNADFHQDQLIIEAEVDDIPSVNLVGSGLSAPLDDGSGLPYKFELSNAYPNPFNSMTRIKFTLEQRGAARVSLYNINGRFVSTLAEGDYTVGSHQVVVNAESMSSGVYLVLLESGQKFAVNKIVLMK